MKQLVLLLILSAFLFSEHPEHPEHPTTIKEPQLTIVELAISIENYIQNDVTLKGGFFVYDKNKKEILTLTLTKIHKERLSNIGGDTYFACADFSASNGNIYDLDIPGKFFEIGMGSHPRYSYWIAADVPETGYVLLYSAYENGWVSGKPTKITYSEQNGLTIDKGLRTVLSNLDISPFTIKSYSVHGMKGSTDPPAVTDGIFTVKIISADYGENPLSLFPFIVTGIIGAGVIILIFSKRRS